MFRTCCHLPEYLFEYVFRTCSLVFEYLFAHQLGTCCELSRHHPGHLSARGERGGDEGVFRAARAGPGGAER